MNAQPSSSENALSLATGCMSSAFRRRNGFRDRRLRTDTEGVLMRRP